jgi:hypothetical protein
LLRAEIQSEGCTLHLSGELDGYSMESVHEFVRRRRSGAGDVRLLLEIDREDRHAFTAYAPRWLRRFVAAGAGLEVRVRGGRE